MSRSLPIILWEVSNTYLACLALALVHEALFYKPEPVGEDAVEHEVGDYCGESKGLAGFPAELPVVVEEGAGDGHGCVAED